MGIFSADKINVFAVSVAIENQENNPMTVFPNAPD